jgi:PH (Pleckstrin Homology) domain-containing protein
MSPEPRSPQPGLRSGLSDAEFAEPVAAPQPWRIKPVLPVTKLLGAVAVAVLVLAFGRRDPVQWFLVAAVAAGLTIWALRDLVAPVRLAADPDGVTVVVGYARRRRLSWSEIETVRLDRRDRLGVRTQMLELDAEDSLHLFSMHDLGAQPDEVLVALLALRSGPLRSGPSSDTPPAR